MKISKRNLKKALGKINPEELISDFEKMYGPGKLVDVPKKAEKIRTNNPIKKK